MSNMFALQRLMRVARLLALSCLGLLACAGVQAGERFSFMTDWAAQAEHGGFYQALAKGFYQRRGLDVKIRPGGVGMDAQKLLAAGTLDAAMGSNGFFVLNLVEAGAPVVAVAAIFQKDPTILMTHPRQDVQSLEDMRGKPIHIGDPSVNTLWRWLKGRYGFEDRHIRKYTFNIAPFLLDKKAIQQGYATSEPLTAEKAGVKPQVFLLADHGYDSYAALIMAPKATLLKREAALRAFVEASLEGWHDYLTGDPNPANRLIIQDNPEMTDDALLAARAKMIDYKLAMDPSVPEAMGTMRPERWEAFASEMQRLGIYSAGLDWRKGVDFRFVGQGGKVP
jgi:NitT/TauT family transport system substrate-binding protein